MTDVSVPFALAMLLTAGLCLARAWVQALRRSRLDRVLGVVQGAPVSGGLASSLDRMGRIGIVARFGSNAGLARQARLAGLRWPVERLASIRFLALAAALSLGLLAPAGVAIALPMAGIAAVAALRLPQLVLTRMARRRRSRLERQVPDLVELLLVTTEAGLSPPIAFRRSAAVIGHPMGAEIRDAVREMDLGVPWRAALDRLADTTESAGLRALGRADEIATPGRGHRPRSTGHGGRPPRRASSAHGGTGPPRTGEDALPTGLPRPSRVPPPDGGAGPAGHHPVAALRHGHGKERR
jgi:hypothetical protein